MQEIMNKKGYEKMLTTKKKGHHDIEDGVDFKKGHQKNVGGMSNSMSCATSSMLL